MKKLLLAIIAVTAAVTFAACGSPVPVNDAVNEATGQAIENMTKEAAVGSYALCALTANKSIELSADSFAQNVLTLEKDGSFVLTVAAAGEPKTECRGTFDVTDAGLLTLTGEKDGKAVYLIAKGEKAVCDGERVVTSGLLGEATVSMEYVKDGVKSMLKAETDKNAPADQNTEPAENTDKAVEK